MRQISVDLYAVLLSSFRPEFFLLVSIGYREADAVAEAGYVFRTLNFTTAAHPVTFGGVVYGNNVALVSYDTPKFNSITEKSSYKLGIVDNIPELTSLSLVGQSMDIRIGVKDEAGELLLSPQDVSLVYSGLVDGVNKINNFEEKILNIEGSAPMADLDAVNPFITSSNSMRQRNKNDTSFDAIFSKEDISYKWGKV